MNKRNSFILIGLFLLAFGITIFLSACSIAEPVEPSQDITILTGNLTSHTQLSNIGIYSHNNIDTSIDLFDENLVSINATASSHNASANNVHGVTGSIIEKINDKVSISSDVSVDSNQGIYWHGTDSGYGIYRQSGGWVQPLKIAWQTGIFLNAGGYNVLLDSPLKIQSNYLECAEMTAPGAGAADTARIYSVVGGDTLTDLAAVFQDGTVDIFAQEATDLDDARFTKPSGTTGDLVMIKPHPGLIKVIMKFPTGEEFVLKEIEYHDAEKIAVNKGCISDNLPQGWEVTTAEQRAEKSRLEGRE